MKTFFTIVLVVGDIALILLSLLWMLAGYLAWGLVALAAAFILVALAARFWLRSPEPPAPAEPEWHLWDEELDAELSPTEREMIRRGYVRLMPSDPVDRHHAQMAAALEPTKPLGILRRPDWPEVHLIQPKPRPSAHRQDNQ